VVGAASVTPTNAQLASSTVSPAASETPKKRRIVAGGRRARKIEGRTANLVATPCAAGVVGSHDLVESGQDSQVSQVK
jgi:hypothetical protein